MSKSISFNSNNLQTYNPSTRTGINTNTIEHGDIPSKIAQLFTKSDANGSAISAINYPTKKITIAGTIHGTSESDLESRLDTFKGYFNGKNKNLDIGYASGTRRYIATANTIGIVQKQKALYATFNIEFICTHPFGLDTTATNLWTPKSAFTSATFTETMTIGGNAEEQLPIITITVNSLTGAGDYVQISNDNNNQELVIYGQNIQAGDVIVIDCAERKVTINDIEVDKYGTFLELEPGSNTITYTDGFTTRSVDVEAEYYKRWL